MASVSTWERIERQKLRRRERRIRRYRPGDRPDSSRPAGTDMLPQIKHIVVLMMENHSFDNYLGTLGRGEGFPLGDDGTPDAENPDSAGTMIRAYHASSTVQEDGVPCQSWSASHTQWAAGKMNGFVTSTEQAAPEGDKTSAMAYWTDQDLPFYHGLARTFPLADRWFSSCLGPTFPNRRFLLAGTANGLMDDLPFNLLDRPRAGTICPRSAVRCARPATCSSGISSSRRPFTRSGWPATWPTFAASNGSSPMPTPAASRRSASSIRTSAAFRRRTRRTSARGRASPPR
jgi:hypothetical protein